MTDWASEAAKFGAVPQQDDWRKKAKAYGATAEPAFDPSAGGGSLSIGPWDTGIATPQWLDRGLSGFGKSIFDTGDRLHQLYAMGADAISPRGRQLSSLITGKDNSRSAEVQRTIDEANRRDAPLMDTGAGITGNVLGTVVQALAPGGAVFGAGKAAAIPGLVRAGVSMMAPTSIPGATVLGATQGFMRPVATGESGLVNTAIGAAGGAAVPAIFAAGSLAKNLVMPFTKSGTDNLAGQTIGRFAKDAGSVLNPQNAGVLIHGSSPTLAEATGDVGLSQLQRTLQNNPDANLFINERLAQNTMARVNALKDIAGNPADRAAWVQARRDVTGPMYDSAISEVPTLTSWAKGQITQLQKRPSFRSAFPQAAALAAEEGIKLNPSNAIQVMHYTKMALDDQISAAVSKGNGKAASAITGTRDKLVSLIESKDFAPAYAAARQTYTDMSKPINQMDVGQALLDKFQPALNDFGATTRTNAESYARALRAGDTTAARALDFPGATMERALGPEQFQTVQNVAHDLARASNGQYSGGTIGNSITGQNLVAQNILRQSLGPVGLPQSWMEAALPQQLMRGMRFAYTVPEQRTLTALGKASASPSEAKRLLELAQKRGLFTQYVEPVMPALTAPSAAAMLGLFD